MQHVVELRAPRQVGVRVEDLPSPHAGEVRVSTLYSGISAGTELAAYRGTSPLLGKRWDAEVGLFRSDGASFSYPMGVWGYSEVGRVDIVGDGVDDLAVGDLVWGIWGHRSHAVLPASVLAGHRMPVGLAPIVGTFDRVAAVALNAVLAAEVNLGETAAVFGQGVIGLLTTQMLISMGVRVHAIDHLPARRELAEQFGAIPVDPSVADTAEQLRTATSGRGVDRVIDLTGSYEALNNAIRAAGRGGTVIAAGFHQGAATALALGEEFHHNQVTLRSSQIGAVPAHLAHRWDRPRLHTAVMELMADRRIDPEPLISHVIPATEAADAFALLDKGSPDVLQVVLDFTKINNEPEDQA
ncbi:zinc-binding dehydrogenase [Propionibacteriaceae bacterium Y1685]